MKLTEEVIGTLNRIIKSNETEELITSQKIIRLNESCILKLIRYFLDKPNLIESFEDDELNYCNTVYETAKLFEGFLNETYLSFYKEEKEQFSGKKEEDIIVRLVTINLEKRLKEFIDKNKVIVLMSGTLHSNEVLEKIFGISNFKVIETELESQGKVSKIKTGLERNFRYNNIKQGRLTRKEYLLALSACIKKAKKPVLVHVKSFADLPSEIERIEYKLWDLMTSKQLKKLQKEHKMAELVDEFKQGKTQILFSTKCKRGMDFPGETCNSIILTKYPYPDTSSLFWKVLNKNHPALFWEFYKDKARRDFLQKIYRGLRSKDDHIYLLSPDTKVLDEPIS